MNRPIEAAFTCLLILQFAAVVFHDWLNVPGWTHGRQVQAVIGRRRLLWATLINAVFPGIAVAFAISFWGRSHPRYVFNYWTIYCAVTVLSAIVMWYVPYLFGADPQKTDQYGRMYAGTRQVFPAHGDNPRPNLLHACFHVLFVLTFALAFLMRFGKE